MDLESTLIRAEALFRRFQRLVEAIDKKDNFPAPRFSGPQLGQSSSSTSGTTPASPPGGSSPTSQQKQQSGAGAKSPGGKAPEAVVKVITPELRSLLSREVKILPRNEVAQKGDGWADKKT